MSVTSDLYLDRAAECARDAAAADLGNVRERFLRAEASWKKLAEQLLKIETVRVQREADKAAEAGFRG